MWIPDVYQGSPTAVTLLIGGGPKLAAFALIMRLLVEGLLPLATTGSDAGRAGDAVAGHR
jgi:NADH-quinone oxidoreductase subunit N